MPKESATSNACMTRTKKKKGRTLPRSVSTGVVVVVPSDAPKKPSPHWYTSPRPSTQTACVACTAKSRSATSWRKDAAAGVRICAASDVSGEMICDLTSLRVARQHSRRGWSRVKGGKANLFDPHTSSLSPSSPSSERVFVGAAAWSERGTAAVGTASLCMEPPTNCWFATAAAAAATEVATTTLLMRTFEDFRGCE